MANEIRIGTSGFQFSDWKGIVYPLRLPDRDMLSYYEKVLGFDTLEVNYTYYRLPYASTMERMVNKTSENFVFVVRSYREMTHEIWEDEKRKTLRNNQEVFNSGLGSVS